MNKLILAAVAALSIIASPVFAGPYAPSAPTSYTARTRTATSSCRAAERHALARLRPSDQSQPQGTTAMTKLVLAAVAALSIVASPVFAGPYDAGPLRRPRTTARTKPTTSSCRAAETPRERSLASGLPAAEPRTQPQHERLP